MFWRKKRATASLQDRVRGSLYGHHTLAEAAAVAHHSSLYEEPWRSYVRAQELVEAGCTADACHLLEQAATRSNLASVHYAQLYHSLRELDSSLAVARRLLGVVIEDGQGASAYHLLGAYVDRRAQFYPHPEGYARWERPNAALDEAIGIVVTMGDVLLYDTPLWTGGHLPPIQDDTLRLTLVASDGLHVLEDARDYLLRSLIVDRLYTAAEKLMQLMRSLM